MRLTASQKLMWLGQRLDPASPLYNMAFAFHIYGAVDRQQFATAFATLLARHDVLRLVVQDNGDTPTQHESDSVTAQVEYLDLSGAPDALGKFSDWSQRRTELPFNLGRQLFACALVKLKPTHFVWYFNQHHLITDAGSCAVLFRELGDLYAGVIASVTAPKYSDYVQAQAEALPVSDRAALRYWQQYPRAQPLSFYGGNSNSRTVRSVRRRLRLSSNWVDKLQSIAATTPALTPEIAQFSAMATLLSSFLYRIGNQQSVLLNTLSHSRSTRALRNAVGMYIETALLDIPADPDANFSETLARAVNGFQQNLRQIRPGISAATSQAGAQVVLNYLPFRFGEFGGMSAKADWLHPNAADADHLLRIQVHDFDAAGGLNLLLDMNSGAFGDREQSILVEQFEHFLGAWVEAPETALKNVPLVDTQELLSRVALYNRTAREWTKPRLPDLLSQIASPDYASWPAIQHQQRTLSYSELDRTSDNLANQLRLTGVGPGVVVALLVKPSIESVVAVVAVLKAGAAFAALDPQHPSERNRTILAELADIAPERHLVMLSDDDAPLDTQSLAIARWNVNLNRLLVDTPKQVVWDRNPDSLCYVLYTSGSTGVPKGTMITDAGLSNYLNWAHHHYASSAAVSMPLFTSLSFDLTLTSLFLPLISGGCVHVHTEDPLLALANVLADDSVDLIKLTPSHLALLKPGQFQQSRLQGVILGGEVLDRSVANKAQASWGPKVAIYNEYGPTETVIGCMIHQFDPAGDTADTVPIGVPIANMQVYVLDESNQPVAQGIVGELCVGGVAVAKGYLNRKAQTAEQFVPNPFTAGTRLYRTGDLGRFNGSNIEFLGRSDRQVKLHGHRIELDELSAVLAQHPLVNRATVNLTKLASAESFCRRCGISSNYPSSRFDPQGVCASCREFAEVKDKVNAYFGTQAELNQIFAGQKASQSGRYTCIALLSGGKDSSYMLYQLAAMNIDILAVTLDNGFISDTAKANIRLITQALNVDHQYLATEHMNTIFADSLSRHSNVCNGCFKTIYTLSMNLAKELGIKCIVTGLARGQLFETRLIDMCYTGQFDPATIDDTIKQARKAYHKIPDAATRLLPTKNLEDDSIYDELEFVDFYRYCDVPLTDMYAFLDENAPWIRPQDTGRSTNCTVNDTGIYVHQQEQGYHNYALPYSWDVRLGHKTREAAMYELDDRIDTVEVQANLRTIGYEPKVRKAEQSLAAFYTADAVLDMGEVRTHLANRLPAYMLPTHFIQLSEMPLTSNGKIDLAALPGVTRARSRDATPPATANEKVLCQVWEQQFGLKVGTGDDFFELGGDSVIAIQIVDLLEDIGFGVEPSEMFEHTTIKTLALKLQAVHKKTSSAKPFAMVDLDEVAKTKILAALAPKRQHHES